MHITRASLWLGAGIPTGPCWERLVPRWQLLFWEAVDPLGGDSSGSLKLMADPSSQCLAGPLWSDKPLQHAPAVMNTSVPSMLPRAEALRDCEPR